MIIRHMPIITRCITITTVSIIAPTITIATTIAIARFTHAVHSVSPKRAKASPKGM